MVARAPTLVLNASRDKGHSLRMSVVGGISAPMSSEHVSRLIWERGGRGFEYAEYPRAHRVEFGGGSVLAASAAPEYRGDAGLANPEEMLVAALSSCHMLTFLAICARKKIVVDRYEDHAVGVLERPAGGKLQVTRVTLRPTIAFAEGHAPDAAALASLHHQAHEGCFIASSVKTAVVVAT
jgi:organic hydroperoxide reductase OsmC/OhrA